MCIIKFNCQYCGKEVVGYKSQKTKFCSPKCCYAFRVEYKGIFKECEQCGKRYKAKSKDQRFCSKECKIENQRTLVGELSPKYHQIEKVCEICGKKFTVKQSKENTARFCSTECMKVWHKEYLNTEERKAKAASIIISNMVNGKIQKTLTKPHRIVDEELDKMGIEYLNEYQVGYYVADIYLKNENLLIEIMGDFWHSNPTTKYKDAKLPQQKNRIGKDKAKHSYILSQYGIELLYLWEYDIFNNIDVCKELITEYIKNKGVLDNYHSFNYTMKNERLYLKDDICVPKFEFEHGVNSSTI